MTIRDGLSERVGLRDGFSLIELMVVIAIIAIIAGIAIPQLAPVIAFTSHEGAARHLAGYGRSAMGHAALMHETLTVKIDLKKQEYWAERLPAPVIEDEDDKASEDDGLPDDELDLLFGAQQALKADGEGLSRQDAEANEKLVGKQTEVMQQSFARMARQALIIRAARVVHDESRSGNDFELPEFELRKEEDELEPEEVTNPLLARTRLDREIFIESIKIGTEVHTSGIVEVEISALGLSAPVTFVVGSEEGDYFTVDWDPMTRDGRIQEGKDDSA